MESMANGSKTVSNDIFGDIKDRMKKSVDLLTQEYMEIRAGRANPAVLDRINVDYYGASTPVSQVAAVSISEARVLVIQPWDPSILRSIEKAIQQSDIGINPQNDGKVIRLIFPQLNEEMRVNLVKDVAKIAESYKVSIRAIRRDEIDKLKKMKKNAEITEDDLKSGEKKIQNITDNYINEIDNLCGAKKSEIETI